MHPRGAFIFLIYLLFSYQYNRLIDGRDGRLILLRVLAILIASQQQDTTDEEQTEDDVDVVLNFASRREINFLQSEISSN